jgi:hypothetical protein
MKVKRLLSLPFAAAADAVTMGNFGDRSFTQQVFDAQRRDDRQKAAHQNTKDLIKLVNALTK